MLIASGWTFFRFIIADPVSLTAADRSEPSMEFPMGQAQGLSTTRQSSVGHCRDDTFVLSSGSGKGSPVICGMNNDQHMIVDTDGQNCVTATFVYGADANTREYEIR